MLLFYQFSVWFIVLALTLYVLAVWRFEKKLKEKTAAIRKTWYLLYVIGAVLYWTVHPESLFTNWLYYLIVAVFFTLTDAFIFLNAYFKRIGSNELAVDTRILLEENNDLLHIYQNRLKTFQYLLKNEPIHIYYGDVEAYAEGIDKLITQFAEKMNISAALCEYNSEESKDHLLEHMEDRFAAQEKLDRKDVYYEENGTMILIPFSIHDFDYVMKLTSEDLVTEFDYLLFTSLTSIYDLLLPNEEEDN
ncbi:type II toxin-antitoxin system SpoIISA family toxin [Bacillus sp. WMMC1349]|uniref:type II toxin-antitoxin system SpoIISA family toxin n=1 Tax=Bacillus sp. WMMC1349 TaxID=2736254 RepID=UPI001555B476|nr:type II toxin-antitoxin system SpoIISA family toxin [Bacillus sp. WMMC1349]NPC92258.1 type II toxin-antitoxin system SpoIISA family toxin [Bacillus sp. WMMC1349]